VLIVNVLSTYYEYIILVNQEKSDWTYRRSIKNILVKNKWTKLLSFKYKVKRKPPGDFV